MRRFYASEGLFQPRHGEIQRFVHPEQGDPAGCSRNIVYLSMKIIMRIERRLDMTPYPVTLASKCFNHRLT